MDMTPELQQLWMDRAKQGEARRFLSKGYQAAVERLEDHRDRTSPCVEGPVGGAMAWAGSVGDGDEDDMSPAKAREKAFELLALADLAELMAAPAQDPMKADLRAGRDSAIGASPEDARCCRLHGVGLMHEPSCPEVQDPEDES